MSGGRIKHPPLAQRMKVLNEYLKTTKGMGFERAHIYYKTAMESLYKNANGWGDGYRRGWRDDF